MLSIDRPIPIWKCHKLVRAFKIGAITHNTNPDITGRTAAASYGASLHPVSDGLAEHMVSAEYVMKHRPEVGGYYVMYDGGYESYSPAAAFEAGYTMVGQQGAVGLSFGDAIDALRAGKKVARAGWNGKGMWLVLVPGQPAVILRPGTPYAAALPGTEQCEILPHIDMWTVNADGRRAMLPGWLASQTDMLSTDWQIVT